MSITDFFIRRSITTTLLMVAILMFGILSYVTLPVSDLPAVEYPTVQVEASLPGANPDIMASSVATPLEKEFSNIAGIDSMSSSSSLGSTNITLQFNHEPFDRRGGTGRTGGDLSRGRGFADEHAVAPFLFEGEPGIAAGAVSEHLVADDDDGGVG